MSPSKLGRASALSTNHFAHRRSVIAAEFTTHAGTSNELDRTLLCSGSSYTGCWNAFGFHGQGRYMFPNGIRYEGNIRHGDFHGRGKLIFPNGNIVHAQWDRGISSNMKFQFADGLWFDEQDWKYCIPNNRMFCRDEFKSVKGIGRHVTIPNRMNNERDIPPGCYNTGEGYYSTKTKCLYSLYNPSEIIRIPTRTEEEWIVNNCTKAEIPKMGFSEELFEPKNYRATDEESPTTPITALINVSFMET